MHTMGRMRVLGVGIASIAVALALRNTPSQDGAAFVAAGTSVDVASSAPFPAIERGSLQLSPTYVTAYRSAMPRQPPQEGITPFVSAPPALVPLWAIAKLGGLFAIGVLRAALVACLLVSVLSFGERMRPERRLALLLVAPFAFLTVVIGQLSACIPLIAATSDRAERSSGVTTGLAIAAKLHPAVLLVGLGARSWRWAAGTILVLSTF
jgi:hypothetical protein